VYLGLVLAGATPQVLAQAAMTRQFDVKDEVEVKDDLDKKPNKVTTDLVGAASSETDNRITRSVERFLAKFKTIDSVASFCSPTDVELEQMTLPLKVGTHFHRERFDTHVPVDQILTVTNLPRAGLDAPLATDAK